MRSKLLTLLLSLLFLAGFSQSSNYEYKGRSSPSIKQEKLREARFIADIMPGFPRSFSLPARERLRMDQAIRILDSLQGDSFYPHGNYREIMDIVSAEISVESNNKVLTAQGNGEILNQEQRNILSEVGLCTDIRIKIRFKYKSWANGSGDREGTVWEGEYTVTGVPDTEAEFPGGYKEMSAYLVKNVFDKTTGRKAADRLQQAIVKFTVDEEGRPVDVKITRSSSDPKIDKLILDAISKMPSWNKGEIISIGEYIFDAANQSLVIHGKTKRITEKESEILKYLCLHRNNVIKREDLLKDLWGENDYFLGRSLDVFITKIRKYLKEDPNLGIENVFGVGFIFNAPGK